MAHVVEKSKDGIDFGPGWIQMCSVIGNYYLSLTLAFLQLALFFGRQQLPHLTWWQTLAVCFMLTSSQLSSLSRKRVIP